MREQTLNFRNHPLRQAALRRLRAYLEPNPATGCLEWQGPVFKLRGGYGVFTMRPLGIKMARAHRVAYVLLTGRPLNQRQHLMHSCDNPLCCNPEHLSIGDQAANAADMKAKGRSSRGEQHHQAKLTEADVRTIRCDRRLYRVIAEDYGISVPTVCDIKRRRSWTWLEDRL